jgi:hypothetical protein
MTTINQRKLMDRLSELVADGYLIRGQVPNTIILTPKGLNVLISFAERPIDKSKLVKVDKFKLVKELLELERQRNAHKE